MLREVIFNDWYTAIIIASLIIIVSAKILSPNRFRELLNNSNYLRIYIKDHKFFNPFDILLFINFCMNAVLVISLYYSTLNKFNLKLNDFITLSGMLGLGVTGKLLIEFIIGYIFKIKDISFRHIFQQISTLNILGIVLLPFNALSVFSYPKQLLLFVVIFSISCLIMIYGLFKSIKNNQKLLINNFFYFILYLCTLEIGPYVILCKLFSYEIN